MNGSTDDLTAAAFGEERQVQSVQYWQDRTAGRWEQGGRPRTPAPLAPVSRPDDDVPTTSMSHSRAGRWLAGYERDNDKAPKTGNRKKANAPRARARARGGGQGAPLVREWMGCVSLCVGCGLCVGGWTDECQPRYIHTHDGRAGGLVCFHPSILDTEYIVSIQSSQSSGLDSIPRRLGHPASTYPAEPAPILPTLQCLRCVDMDLVLGPTSAPTSPVASGAGETGKNR